MVAAVADWVTTVAEAWAEQEALPPAPVQLSLQVELAEVEETPSPILILQEVAPVAAALEAAQSAVPVPTAVVVRLPEALLEPAPDR